MSSRKHKPVTAHICAPDRLAAIVAVLFVGCSRDADIAIHRCGGQGEPDFATLHCTNGLVLRVEATEHVAKAWCEPADGGAK